MQPKRNSFAAFRREDPQFGSAIWCHRIIGLPGDIVRIQDGIVSVNGRDADAGLTLSHEYKVGGADKIKLTDAEPDLIGTPLDGDTLSFCVSDKLLADLGIHPVPLICVEGEPDSFIQRQYGKHWNVDQFGPVRVPANQYFLLGDNRHNAMDSRYIGFVPGEDIVGIVIGK
jgi:signal peptidase I